MNSFRIPFLAAAGVVFLLLSEIPAADGQLRWPHQRKQEIEVRLIALARHIRDLQFSPMMKCSWPSRS